MSLVLEAKCLFFWSAADGLWWQNKRAFTGSYAEQSHTMERRAIIVEAQMTCWIIVQYCRIIVGRHVGVDRTVSKDELQLSPMTPEGGPVAAEKSGESLIIESWNRGGAAGLKRDRGDFWAHTGRCGVSHSTLAPFLILMRQSPSVCQELTPDALPVATSGYWGHNHPPLASTATKLIKNEQMFWTYIHFKCQHIYQGFRWSMTIVIFLTQKWTSEIFYFTDKTELVRHLWQNFSSIASRLLSAAGARGKENSLLLNNKIIISDE